MNKLFMVLVMIFIAASGGTVWSNPDLQVRGLFYLDNHPVSISIKDGIIENIERINPQESDLSTVYIAPGFIDNQVNGYAGISFSFGGGDLTVDGVEKATKALWRDGITSYLPTLTTNSHELLVKNLGVLANAMDAPQIRGSIPGFHLEGPYLSPVDGCRGAQPLKWIRKPDWNEFQQYIKAADDHILQVTVAPEIDGAMDFIRYCSRENIVVALGHHNASAEQVREAADLGASLATHLGNGCANSINRHANPLWPQLAEDRITATIICDGFHLRPEEIKTFYKAKGIENTIIVSDVTSYASLPPGEYTGANGETIELTPEGMLQYPAQKVLYGSASPITRGVGHIMEVTGCTLADAVRMASSNVARVNHLDDRGVIEPGKRADIVLLTIDNYKIKIVKTIVAGEVVYDVDKE